MQDSPEAQAIRIRMDEVRCDLDEGVQEMVESARDMSDWRHYVKACPGIFGCSTAPRGNQARHYSQRRS
jgi:hypothetical protein